MNNPGSIIKNPRITEKATIVAEGACYTFDVAKNATKKEIEKAVTALYKVTPRMVRTVTMKPHKVMPRGKRGKVGSTGGGKKAYVYLKKGDKIEVL
jgi:large subunit ribosomal protein L23